MLAFTTLAHGRNLKHAATCFTNGFTVNEALSEVQTSRCRLSDDTAAAGHITRRKRSAHERIPPLPTLRWRLDAGGGVRGSTRRTRPGHDVKWNCKRGEQQAGGVKEQANERMCVLLQLMACIHLVRPSLIQHRHPAEEFETQA
jgi:hypothetical protein